MWVRLLKPKALDYHGKLKLFQPGDWYQVGKHEAQLWIANAEAEVPGRNELKVFVGDVNMGILVIGSKQAATLGLADIGDKVSVQCADRPILPWERTLIWNPTVVLRQELVPTGFKLLEKWDVALPLWNYDELAASAGTADERKLTAAVIRDLRVPMYDPRLMFVRRNERTVSLMSQWATERNLGNDMRLSLHRALYQVKPFVLPLPVTWVGQQVMEG